MTDRQRLRWLKGSELNSSEPWTWTGFVGNQPLYRVTFKRVYWAVQRLGPLAADLEHQDTFGQAKAHAQRDWVSL